MAAPNHLTWILTINAAAVSKDIAERVVVIKVARPDFDPGWQQNAIRFVEDHRWEILSDIKLLLESN